MPSAAKKISRKYRNMSIKTKLQKLKNEEISKVCDLSITVEKPLIIAEREIQDQPTENDKSSDLMSPSDSELKALFMFDLCLLAASTTNLLNKPYNSIKGSCNSTPHHRQSLFRECKVIGEKKDKIAVTRKTRKNRLEELDESAKRIRVVFEHVEATKGILKTASKISNSRSKRGKRIRFDEKSLITQKKAQQPKALRKKKNSKGSQKKNATDIVKRKSAGRKARR